MAQLDLLIYGDSFGEETLVAYPPNHPMYPYYTALLSFHELLRQSGQFRSVRTLAVGGTDFWSQYEVFLKTYRPGTAVIWFETHPGRLVSPCGIQLCNLNNVEARLYEHTHGYYSKQGDNEPVLKILDAGRDYFVYLSDDEYDRFAQAEMVRDVEQRCPNILWLPCFNDSITCKRFQHNVGQATMTEGQVFDAITRTRKFWDLRRNHMTEQNHRILAEEILAYYQSGKPIDYTRWVRPDWEQRHQYFRVI